MKKVTNIHGPCRNERVVLDLHDQGANMSQIVEATGFQAKFVRTVVTNLGGGRDGREQAFFAMIRDGSKRLAAKLATYSGPCA